MHIGTMQIGLRQVGPEQPCFIIAEAGVNHNGDLDLAHRLVDAAADMGADAVKFQTWITEKILKPGAKKADYQKLASPADEDQFAMAKRLELPYAWHPELKSRAEDRGLIFLSTPDEIDSAKFLCSLGVPALKVGSAELTNLPHLEQLARLDKPLVVSTGMASLEETARAVETIRAATTLPFALLHCVSAIRAGRRNEPARDYDPSPDFRRAGRAFRPYRRMYGRIAGRGVGMCIYEKHLTLDKTLPGPDHAASSDPAEFAEVVHAIRKAEVMLGSGEKVASPSEINTRQVVSRTLLYAASLPAGHRVAAADFEALRCGRRACPPMPPLD